MSDTATMPEDLEDSGLGMSNFDLAIDDGLEAALRDGKRGAHYGWEFYGVLWFQEGLFYEKVQRHHADVDVKSAPSLRELMEVVNDEWEWE